jgi:hypothetical protein
LLLFHLLILTAFILLFLCRKGSSISRSERKEGICSRGNQKQMYRHEEVDNGEQDKAKECIQKGIRGKRQKKKKQSKL